MTDESFEDKMKIINNLVLSVTWIYCLLLGCMYLLLPLLLDLSSPFLFLFFMALLHLAVYGLSLKMKYLLLPLIGFTSYRLVIEFNSGGEFWYQMGIYLSMHVPLVLAGLSFWIMSRGEKRSA